jgi:hypothetical protein
MKVLVPVKRVVDYNVKVRAKMLSTSHRKRVDRDAKAFPGQLLACFTPRSLKCANSESFH